MNTQQVAQILTREIPSIERRLVSCQGRMCGCAKMPEVGHSTVDMATASTQLRQKMAVDKVVVAQAMERIRRINIVLKKIEEGWDGSCVLCGEKIPQKRLITVPGLVCLSCIKTKCC